MTPQERQLVAELFDRLESLEAERRDPDAERTIAEGLSRAPHAPYALVQTVLVQDEALKRADARIRELEANLGIEPPRENAGFLDNMRDALFGRRDDGRGSVPPGRPGDRPMGVPPGFRTGAPEQQPMNAPMGGGPFGGGAPMGGSPMQQQGGAGGSFLGTAAAAAAGVIGGSLLLNSIRGMFGQPGQAHGAFDPGLAGGSSSSGSSSSPWGGNASSGDLARDAGLNDVGSGGFGSSRSAAWDDGNQRTASLFGNDDDTDDNADDNFDSDVDFDGGSDTA